MKIVSSQNVTKTTKIVATASVIALLSSCAKVQSGQLDTVKIDGSSTVYPITQRITEEFNQKDIVSVEIENSFSGTGGGFEKFCVGATDINSASRPIQTDEMVKCKEAGVVYIELPVAFDGITVVVNSQNNWAKEITIDELEKIWQPQSQGKISNWNQVRTSWPDKPLRLYGPGADSGTYDYFTEAVVGKAGASRSDYVASEDDDLLVQEVSSNPNALGYFGLAYYESNPGQMKPLAVDSGSGAVLPSSKTVGRGQYQPLSRPLFIYINLASAQNNPAVREFIYYYLERAPEIVAQVGYIPLSKEAYRLDKIHYNKGKVGTVFEGKSQFDLTIDDMLRKQAEY